jgi:outer membrane protein TolC
MNLNNKNKNGLKCSAVALTALLLLAGCAGIATKDEKAARKQAAAVTADYRPKGQKPTLPVLTAESSLSNYLAFAMLNQPKVESAYNDWLVSVERITQARSLPDPQFTFQMDIQNVVTSVMPGFMGLLPWPDKLRIGAKVASAQSQSKYFAFQAAVLSSAFEVKRAYFELSSHGEKIRITKETLQLLNNLERTTRAQNEAGRATLQDVLRAQVERDSLANEIKNLEDSHGALIIQFKASLGLGASDPEPPVPSRFESTPLNLSANQVLEAALSRNNQLKAMEADVRAAEVSILLAEKSRRPDFTLGFMADAKTSPTLYRFPGNPGTMTLPIWRDKIAAQIAEAQANKRSAEARLSDAQITLAADVAERTYLYREATRNMALLRDQLLPKARQSLELAQAGYLTGQTDFLNLVDAERTLLNFQLSEVDAAAQREIVLAELSLIVQGMPPSGSTIQSASPASGGANSSASKTSGGGM